MACFRPLAAYRLGGQIHFGDPGPTKVAERLKLPCGRCIGCRLEYSRQWATRVMFEAQLHDANCMITLTYADEHLPYPPSLDYSHYQLFMKRLRKMLGHKVRYFAVGEYGDRTFRPHFHACIFGTDFPDRVLVERSRTGHNLYRSDLLDAAWPFGRARVNDLGFDSAAYVARYCMKKITGRQSEQHYEWIDPYTGEVTHLRPEFAKMSLKPGIGGEWYEKYASDVYKGHDYVIVNGRKVRPPRYFDRLLERSDPERFEEVKAERVLNAKKYAHDNTPERLYVRETVKEASINQLSPRGTL